MATGAVNPYLVRHALINLAGNIVMFIPLGFLLPCLWSRLRPFGRFLPAIVAIIVGIEPIQLFTLLGSYDIDDLLLNTIGSVIGFGLLRLADKLRLRKASRKGDGKG